MDSRQLAYWLIATVFLVVIPLVATRQPVVRRVAGAQLRRLGGWAWEQLQPTPELDPLAEDLRRVLRREQLRLHIQRLQRILATDTSMSATRQLANRIAYAWLVRELESIRDLAQPRYLDDSLISWQAPTPVWTSDGLMAAGSARAPQVEVLEIGWRH